MLIKKELGMEFKKTGIPGFGLSDDFDDLTKQLDIVRLGESPNLESMVGTLRLDGKDYLMGVARPTEGDGNVSSLEVRILFPGDTFEGIELLELTEAEFMQKLSKIGSTPVKDNSGIWWPKEHIAFYVYEDTPSTICWWAEGRSPFDYEE